MAVVSNTRYHLFAYRAKDGSDLWSASHGWIRDNHGGHIYHPIIVGDMIIVEPRAYGLFDGRVRINNLPPRGGCSTMSAAGLTVHYVNWDYRIGSFYFWDIDTGKKTKRAGSRSSCWLSIISGGGMIFAPTASSGCTCRYPLQTSIGYRSW